MRRRWRALRSWASALAFSFLLGAGPAAGVELPALCAKAAAPADLATPIPELRKQVEEKSESDPDTSVAILDALNAFDGPVFEIHISNVHKREAFRHHSYVSSRADGVIAGFGTQGSTVALQRLARLIDETAAKSG